MGARDEVTAALADLGANPHAFDRLLPLVYDELRVLARQHRWRWQDERAPGTISLVHEAYLKLVDQTRVRWESRAQFFYLASRAMRSVLIDHARRRTRQKRGGAGEPVPLDDDLIAEAARSDELISLDDALTRLATADAQLARIVECRFFGGLTIEETAAALGLSAATIKRGWTTARAWLYQQLHPASAVPPPPHASGSETG
jgi:RNA polymerase sigma factor (TIGR02999 family)